MPKKFQNEINPSQQSVSWTRRSNKFMNELIRVNTHVEFKSKRIKISLFYHDFDIHPCNSFTLLLDKMSIHSFSSRGVRCDAARVL